MLRWKLAVTLRLEYHLMIPDLQMHCTADILRAALPPWFESQYNYKDAEAKLQII